MNKTAALTALSALSQDMRLDVFRLLVRRGGDGMSAGEIGRRLGAARRRAVLPARGVEAVERERRNERRREREEPAGAPRAHIHACCT